MQTDFEHLPIAEDGSTPPDLGLNEDMPANPSSEPDKTEPDMPEPVAGVEQRLRTEYADLAGVAAQAQRLGVPIDVADAMAKGTSADALRRSVLDQLAARSDATDLVAAAPAPGITPTGESPIVKRARQAHGRAGAQCFHGGAAADRS